MFCLNWYPGIFHGFYDIPDIGTGANVRYYIENWNLVPNSLFIRKFVSWPPFLSLKWFHPVWIFKWLEFYLFSWTFAPPYVIREVRSSSSIYSSRGGQTFTQFLMSRRATRLCGRFLYRGIEAVKKGNNNKTRHEIHGLSKWTSVWGYTWNI